MEQEPVFVGIDVAKDRVDVALRPSGDVWEVAYDESGVNALGIPVAVPGTVLRGAGGDRRVWNSRWRPP